VNFEDERYVRLYTRDTPRWISWRWETRAVFEELLRKVDRTGRIEWPARVGTKALAESLRIPHRVVAAALEQLAEQDGPNDTPTIVLGAGWLTLTKYVEGQNAKSRAMTGAERTAEWRARQNGSGQRSIAECDDASQRDDDCDDVTPSGAVLTQPTQPNHARARGGKRKAKSAQLDVRAIPVLDRIDEHRVRLGHRKLWSSERIDRYIVARLEEGVPLEYVLTVYDVRAVQLEQRPEDVRYFDAVSPLTGPAANGKGQGGWYHSCRMVDEHQARERGTNLRNWTPPGGITADELDARLGEGRRRA
jgi:hypothetical protein